MTDGKSKSARGGNRPGTGRKPGVSRNRETALALIERELIREATTHSNSPAELSKEKPRTLEVFGPLAEKAFGSDSLRDKTAIVFITQLCDAMYPGRAGRGLQESGDFCINTVASIGPRDAVETMLVVQMIGTHNNAMDLLRTKQPREAARLLRAYAAQVVALRDYRRKGEQRVTIEHVSVGAGGQAIVGQVVTGGAEK